MRIMALAPPSSQEVLQTDHGDTIGIPSKMSRLTGKPEDPGSGQYTSTNNAATSADFQMETEHDPSFQDARPLLRKASFFLGDLRDGLPMLNMQAAYLISSKGFSEGDIGLLFLVFGLSQFLCMAPAGYLMDYSNRKIEWVAYGSLGISAITIFGTLTAEPGGEHMLLLLSLNVLQGALTAILPSGFNAITLGIVGTKGFTHQVSRNKMMNHLGTALVVAAGSLIAYHSYPNLGALFVVSPLAAAGVWYYLTQIRPEHVHRDAARGLILESPTWEEYELADDIAACKREAAEILQWNGSDSETSTYTSDRLQPVVHSSAGESQSTYRPPVIQSDGLEPPSANQPQVMPSLSPSLIDPRSAQRITSPMPRRSLELQHTSSRDTKSDNTVPSFNLGWSRKENTDESAPRTPLAVLMNPRLLVFVAVIFLFHLSNSSVLPLVMQSLTLRDEQSGMLLSGLCIFIAQGFMAFFAKLCGDYSPYWGRKTLMLVGLFSLPVRCLLLTGLMTMEDSVETERGNQILKALILSTQLLDSVGAGIIGTLQILVTADISGGTGRFSLLLGVSTAAMCLGATISGYLGQALAQDYGYHYAFAALGVISLAPFCLYACCMPETLPEDARPQPKKRRRRLREVLKRLNEERKKLVEVSSKHFQRVKADPPPVDSSPMVNGTVEFV